MQVLIQSLRVSPNIRRFFPHTIGLHNADGDENMTKKPGMMNLLGQNFRPDNLFQKAKSKQFISESTTNHKEAVCTLSDKRCPFVSAQCKKLWFRKYEQRKRAQTHETELRGYVPQGAGGPTRRRVASVKKIKSWGTMIFPPDMVWLWMRFAYRSHLMSKILSTWYMEHCLNGCWMEVAYQIRFLKDGEI